jgi:hypothetical protein
LCNDIDMLLSQDTVLKLKRDCAINLISAFKFRGARCV